MENEGKIAELLAEALKRLDRLIDQHDETNATLQSVEKRTEKVENQLIKLNAQTTENTRAIFKLADKIDQLAELDKRVKELEKVVFK